MLFISLILTEFYKSLFCVQLSMWYQIIFLKILFVNDLLYQESILETYRVSSLLIHTTPSKVEDGPLLICKLSLGD